MFDIYYYIHNNSVIYYTGVQLHQIINNMNNIYFIVCILNIVIFIYSLLDQNV